MSYRIYPRRCITCGIRIVVDAYCHDCRLLAWQITAAHAGEVYATEPDGGMAREQRILLYCARAARAAPLFDHPGRAHS